MTSLLDFLNQNGQGGLLAGLRTLPAAPGGGFAAGVGNFLGNNPLMLMALGGGIAQGGIGRGLAAAVPAAQYEQQQRKNQAEQAATYQALLNAGVPHRQAVAAALNRDVLKTISGAYFDTKPSFTQIGEDMYGNKQFGFVHPATGKVVPIGGGTPEAGGAPAVGLPIGGINHSLKGEDYLAQFPPEMQDAIKNYIEGKSLPTGNPRSNFAHTIKMSAQKYGEDIGMPVNDVTFMNRRKMRTDLSSSLPKSMGGVISNGKGAFSHLADLSDEFVTLTNARGRDALFAGDIGSAANSASNVIAPSSVTKVADNALKYGREAAKFYAATGGGAGERMHALKITAARTSTANEQAAFLETEKKMMIERLQQKEAQIRDTLGQAYLDQNPVMTKELQHTVTKIDTNIARLRQQTPKPAGYEATANITPGMRTSR
jgi:hypothetical protein